MEDEQARHHEKETNEHDGEEEEEPPFGALAVTSEGAESLESLWV